MEHLSIGPQEEDSPLLSLPDELLLQIISLCEPASLLQLSRCSRSFRDILLATSGEHIWTTSRLSYAPIKCRKTQMFPFGVSFTNEVEVPLPDRFDGIAEPAFARLMFEKGCSSCRSHRGKAYTALQLRLCDTCRDTHCVKRSRLLDVIQPFAGAYHYTEEDANAWLASVRLHCSKQQAILEEDLYWKEEVQKHTKLAIQGSRVTKLTLDAKEMAASKKRDQFERQWREWLEASRVVNEGSADPRLAGSTQRNSLV